MTRTLEFLFWSHDNSSDEDNSDEDNSDWGTWDGGWLDAISSFVGSACM